MQTSESKLEDDPHYQSLLKLHTQIYELRAHLGAMLSLMQFDIDEQRIRPTETRMKILSEAKRLMDG